MIKFFTITIEQIDEIHLFVRHSPLFLPSLALFFLLILITFCYRRSQFKKILSLCKQKEKELSVVQTECTELRIKIEQTEKSSSEKLQWLQNTQSQLSNSFKAVAVDSLQNNSEMFMQLAQTVFEKFHRSAQLELESKEKAISHLIEPIHNSLCQVNKRIEKMKEDKDFVYTSLTEQIKHLATTHHQLHSETTNLVRALRTPTVRGQWGEMQLRRTVEIAGMIEHCDFVEQKTVMGESGQLRPDMLVHLPNKKKIIIDAKAPLLAYLEAAEMPDGKERTAKLKLHAKHVRSHITQLSSKSYWEQFSSPEFVVLFLPGENFFSAALKQDKQLIEYAAQQNVVLATPTTLITLLRTIAYGWKQEKVTQYTEEISHLGRTLYERLHIFSGHLQEMRKGLERAIYSYNKAVGSFENRVLVSARKFQELGTNNEDIDILEPIDKSLKKTREETNEG